MIRQSVASEELNGMRIDKYLAEAFAELSHSHLQKLLKSGCILVNGKPIKSNYRVNADGSVELEIPEAMEPEIVSEKMDSDIVYEDKGVVTVNRPKGMVVHPAAEYYNGALVNGLMEHYKDELSGINGVMRPGIVHRIDIGTTELLIMCGNDKTHNEVTRQLKEHSITRRYRAIIRSVVKEDKGTMDAPTGRHSVDRRKMSISEKDGREAVTHYRILERFRQLTYIECRLETGRTYQIRVYMVSIHHPLPGDIVYGPAKCPYRLQG